jgi:ATP-dependent Clp protease adaptor protein ClpS
MSDSAEKKGSGQSNAATAVKPKQKRKPKTSARGKPRKLPPYHVVLVDDDDHSYEYVIEMLRCLFGYPDEMGFKIADEVDAQGRAVVATTHKELAELKRDQITGYGIDFRVATCAGSMSAFIEPAEKQ